LITKFSVALAVYVYFQQHALLNLKLRRKLFVRSCNVVHVALKTLGYYLAAFLLKRAKLFFFVLLEALLDSRLKLRKLVVCAS
jgi:hypothetical protein